MKKWKGIVVAASVVAASVTLTPNAKATDSPPLPLDRQSAAPSPIKVVVPTDVVEGEVYAVRLTVAKPRRFKRIHVQRLETNVLRNTEWVTVRKLKSRRKLALHVVGGVEDQDRFRAIAVPKRGSSKAVKSRPAAARVWHWYPLTSFPDYYKTGGVLNSNLSSFPMNGQQYKGWRVYGPYRSWEARYTPGRNCSQIRGDFGLHDDSDDGSSGNIKILTDGDRVAFSSQTLTPGTIQRATVDLHLTYRMSIVATDSSPEDVFAHPAIGAGELLCTGFEN